MDAIDTKAAWLERVTGLLHKANYSLSDDGVWVNLHMLHSQGLTPEAAVAKLPIILPRLAK